MVVQHNLTAMNSNRMLNVTTKSQAKSTEKLSSGYKINRAADDAAGLSISEKMRKQIRGLTQASANAQDGISAVQTAEGALSEVHDMLQRMNELAVKASNGTQSTDDKKYIQDEIDQLVTEIDRVSETTKFNEIYLLKGDNTKGKTFTNGTKKGDDLTKTGTNSAQNVTTLLSGYVTETIKGDGTLSFKASSEATGSGTLTPGNADNGNFVVSKLDIYKNGGTTSDKATFTALAQAATGDNSAATTGKTYAVYTLCGQNELLGKDIKEIRLYADSAATYAAAAKTDSVMTMTYSQLDTFKNLIISDIRSSQGGESIKTIEINDNFTSLQLELFADKQDEALDFNLQVGADTTTQNKIGVNIKSMSASTLGINGLRVDGSTSDRADAAVNTIAAAIQKVSTQRSALGAAQNRLEHTISNLDNIVENTTSAESAIRDTDMATEMVKYSNNNILAQAGQAMLAQANQSNQGVLSLLG